jgi:hypothetical protein
MAVRPIDPKAEEQALRLVPNCHVFMGPTGSLLIYTPAEELIKLEARVEEAVTLLALLRGGITREAARAVIDGDELRETLDALAEEGIFDAEEPAPIVDPSERHVEVRGTNPVADAVAALLRAAGAASVRQTPEDAPFEDADLIVACSGWLPDQDWLALDAWCRERGIPWHRCYAEGSRFYLGPLTVPGQTAGYIDVRDRYLAASAYPEEMQAYWRYLETDAECPEVTWPGPAAVALIAGALAQDALALLRGDPIPTLGCQLAFDPAALSWERHPVLPVPRDLLMDAATVTARTTSRTAT